MSDLPGFPGFPSPPSPPPPSGGTPSVVIALPFLDIPPSQATDSNGAVNTVVEGAAVNTLVGITANSVSPMGFPLTYSLGADSSGGGFKIDPVTGVVSVADPSKINFETAPGHAYTITVNSSDGFISSAQNFTIAVTDVAPSTPVDSNAAANAVTEGAPANTLVGVTASSTDVNGPAVTYSLTGDTSGGGFTINAATGVVTVADPSKIDYESAPGHAYTITVQSSDGTLTNSQVFTIAVNDSPLSAPVDTNAIANSVAEGAAAGTAVGVTALATDPNGPIATYSLTGDTSGGGFTINATTGVVTVADPSKIDYESAAGHAYNITVQANDGLQTTSQTFTIAVSDVAPSTPIDSNASGNTVVEGAANGTAVGVTASSTDINGPAVTYALIGDTSGGGFTINATTGVVTVADSSKIDYESTGPGHTYTVTAQASDGTLASSQTFTIAVANVAPSTPVDSNAAANSVSEGAAAGTTVGVTASSTDVNGPAVTYSLTGDTSGGGFTINATTGVITVADPTKIDYESTGPGHSYTVTAQASDGTLASSQTFTIGVADVAPSTPVDTNAGTNTISEGAANGSTVGVTASSTDVNGPAVTYSLIGDTSGGGFTINATTGVVTVADSTKIDFESSGGSYTVTAMANDGTLASSQTFTIAVSDVAPSTPVDSDGATNQVSMNAPVGTYAGITASSTDVNGPTVTYSLVGDTSGGGFTINAATGQVTVADPTKVIYNAGSPTYDVTVDSSDGTLHAQQTFTITVIPNTPPVANDDALSATEAGGANNSVAGVNPSGNVILGTGSAGATQDTDTEDASSALTVIAVHTGPEGGSTGTGTVGQDLIGSHGTLHLNADGSYTYQVSQTDAQVQALHAFANTITDQFNYTIQDTGGLQDTATLTVTIHGANDLPQAVADTGTMTEDDAPTSFNVIANDTQDPDSTAANTITLGPGGITVTGPAGETFVNTDATASIVSNQVQVSLVNAHFQQLALGEHATVTVPYTLTGDAGDTSSANLVVTVNGVNDVPVAVDDSGSMTEDQSGHAFTVLGNDTLDADHGAPNNVTVGAVSNLSAPSGENIDLSDISVSVNGSNQVVVNLGSDFQHMHDGESTTFDVAYTLHGDQAGDISNATLHVTVTGANDAPTASNFTFNGTNSATGNTDLVVNDPTDGAPSTTGPNKTISASILSGASDVDGPGPLIVVAGNIATAHGGSVTMQSDGDFIYKPPVGYLGSDSFNYQVSDQNAGASGVGLGTGTITINVTSPHVWYVNADAATDGDGSSENPFNTLSHFAGVGGVDGAGDTIFLETSSAHYTGGLTLENNEQLISQSAGLTVPDGGGGAGTVTLVSASGANAVIDGGVILASGNNIQGVNFGSSSTFSLSGTNVGTSTIDNVKQGVINNTGTGGGISITGSGNALTYDFGSITSTGGTNGIVISGASGTFHSHGGTISGTSGADVSLANGTLDFAQDGSISDSTGTVVSISSMTGGTQSFTGAIGTTGSTDGAINLTNNTGATINFSGGIALSTGASNAFSATGGGTINVTGTNHLTTTTGTALNIANTTIGSSNVTFHDISANGGSADGIILDTTGSSGGLHVTGTGTTAGSGGTIANKAGADGSTTQGIGIYLNNTSDVQLANMQLNDFQNYGIFGNNVNGFALAHSVINSTGGGWNGNQAGSGDASEASVAFDNLTGTASVSNTSISGGFTDNFRVTNSSGTLNRITFDTDNFGAVSSGAAADGSQDQGHDGLLLESLNSAVLNATVQNSTFTSARGDLFNLTNNGTGADDLIFSNNHLSNNYVRIATGGGGFTLGSNGTGNTTYNIANNTFRDAVGTAVLIVESTTSNGVSMVGSFTGNSIGVPGVANSGSLEGDGLKAQFVGHLGAGGTGVFKTTIANNTIQEYNNFGVDLLTGGGAGASSGTYEAIVTGNTIGPIGSNTSAAQLQGIGFNGGTTPGDTFNSYLEIGGTGADANTVNNWTATNGLDDIRIRQRQATTVHLTAKNGAGTTDYAGANNDNAAVVAFLEANNNTTGHVSATNTVPTGGGFVGGAPPLYAAPGGVQASAPTPGETHLSQSELDSVVAAAIAQWATAGASADQLAALHATSFSVDDLAGDRLGEQTPGHITIDVDAAGHGWFVDPTPFDNFEFSHAQNIAGTDLLTDPSNAAAGHLDLLTTVTHELGHVLGLADTTDPTAAHDLMYINLVDGERRLPDAADVTQANSTLHSFQTIDNPIAAVTPGASSGLAAQPVVTDAGHGGGILFGSTGADNFQFANVNVHASTPPPVTLVENYSFAQGDTFDFSAITSQFHSSGMGDALIVRAVEDASGKFATLQVDTIDPHGLPGQPSWVSVAQIDGAHTGDAVNVLIDGAAVHLTQLHVGLLA